MNLKLCNNMLQVLKNTALKYGLDFEGFDGRDLTPQDVIENNPVDDGCLLLSTDSFVIESAIKVHPTVTNEFIHIDTQLNEYTVELYNIHGQLLLSDRSVDRLNISEYSTGMYFLKIINDGRIKSVKIIKSN